MNGNFQLVSVKERLPDEGTLILFFTEKDNSRTKGQGLDNNPNWKLGYHLGGGNWVSNGHWYTDVSLWSCLPHPTKGCSVVDKADFDRTLIRDLRATARILNRNCMYTAADLMSSAAARIAELIKKRGVDHELSASN